MTHTRIPLSRRSFLATCSAATVAALSGWSEAEERRAPLDGLPPGIKRLVDRKRKAIRDAMAKEGIPGGAVALERAR